MSLIMARKKRTTLRLSVAGVMVLVAAVSAISALDPGGALFRIAMIMVTLGAGLWLPWRQLVPAVALSWLVPNLGRGVFGDAAFLDVRVVVELLGLAGIACLTAVAQRALRDLEEESLLLGTANGDIAGLNPETGIFHAHQLKPALQAELARSRRFRRTFALVVANIDELRQRFDYRDEALWRASLDATTRLLRETRNNVDRVFHYKDNGFAMILPEAGGKDIAGLVKRLRRIAHSMKPSEGEPGGPMPVRFGATFFPDCATTVDDLLLRAEVALRIAAGNMTRYQLDGAEAPALAPPESFRRERARSAIASGGAQTLAAGSAAPGDRAGPGAVGTPRTSADPMPSANAIAIGEGSSSATAEIACEASGSSTPTADSPAGREATAPSPDEADALAQRVQETLDIIRSAKNDAA
jgi:GGDEF domain-containing protein